MQEKFFFIVCFIAAAILRFSAGQESTGNEELKYAIDDKDAVSRQAPDNTGPGRNSRALYNPVLRPSLDPYSYSNLPNQFDGRGYALRPAVAGRGYQYPLQYGRPDAYGNSPFYDTVNNYPFSNFGDPFFGNNVFQNDFFGLRQPGYNAIPYQYAQNPEYYDARLYRPYYGRHGIPVNPSLLQTPYQQGVYPGYGVVRPTGIALQPNGIGIGDGYAPNGIAVQKDGVTLQTSTGLVGANGNGLQNSAAGISDFVDRDVNGLPFLVHPSVRNRIASQNEQSHYRNNRPGRPLRVGSSFQSPPIVRRPNTGDRDQQNYFQRRGGIYDSGQRVDNLDYVESLVNRVESGNRFPVHPLPYAIVGDMNLDRRPNGDGYTTPVVLNPTDIQRINNGRPGVVFRLRNRAYTSG